MMCSCCKNKERQVFSEMTCYNCSAHICSYCIVYDDIYGVYICPECYDKGGYTVKVSEELQDMRDYFEKQKAALLKINDDLTQIVCSKSKEIRELKGNPNLLAQNHIPNGYTAELVDKHMESSSGMFWLQYKLSRVK